MSEAKPTTKDKFRMLAPMTLPKTKLGFPSTADAIAIDNSGREVAKLIIKPVRANFPKPVRREKYVREETTQPGDLRSKREKAKIRSKSKSIVCHCERARLTGEARQSYEIATASAAADSSR